jgi:hypothetical protein
VDVLQEAHLKDIVDFGPDWQLQPICDFADVLNNLVGAIEFRTQLAATLHIQGSHGTVKEAQPHPLPHGEIEWPVMPVIKHRVMLLGLH